MKKGNYQICNRCVMDSSDPGISFDENGYCNHCIEFHNRRGKHKYQGEKSDEELKLIVQEIKKSGKGKKYDCVLGLSGGIDSSYTAYKAIKLGLRPLAVHLDNGWNAEEAVNNIKNIARKLNIDYQSFVLNWEEFKDLQLSFLKASIPEAETPTDIAIPGALHKVAAQHNIKYVISGGNFATEGILPKHWHYNAKDLKYFYAIHKKYGKKKLKNFPSFGYKKETYYKLVKGIKMIYLLNYVPYIKDDAMDLLKDKLEWKYYGGKHYESKYTGFIQSYYLFEKFNIDYRRATFSTQICAGDMDRNEAINLLKNKPYNNEENAIEKEYIAKKLSIDLKELEDIINSTPKWYSDYPNDEKKLSFIYNTYRKVFKKEKLANF
jgi:N-acetyl sugar amidotransferase